MTRDIRNIAREVLDAWGTGRQIGRLSERYPGFGLAEAYRVTAEVRRGREAAAARAVGRKIGFTNRTVWAEPPMWGYVYDQTVHDLQDNAGDIELFAFAPISSARAPVLATPARTGHASCRGSATSCARR